MRSSRQDVCRCDAMRLKTPATLTVARYRVDFIKGETVAFERNGDLLSRHVNIELIELRRV